MFFFDLLRLFFGLFSLSHSLFLDANRPLGLLSGEKHVLFVNNPQLFVDTVKKRITLARRTSDVHTHWKHQEFFF